MNAFRTRFVAMRVELTMLAAVLLLGSLAAFASVRPEKPEPLATATVQLESSRATQLIDATDGDNLVDFEAVGQSAEMINASLPFDRSGLDPARPFAGAEGLDFKRAQLCLAQAIYYEAGFEPIEGRRAVAQVVLNRVRHAAFPNTVCGVVYQGAKQPVCQFSFTCDGSLERRPEAGAWAQAERIAREALNGSVEKSVGMATHYHADYVAPRWAPMLAKVEKLGAHIFYRWPGSWGRRPAFRQTYGHEPDPALLRPTHYLGKRVEELVELAEGESELTIPAGPPIPRAENDVGGLLDTSKGWTLNIPMPDETRRGSEIIASRQAVADEIKQLSAAGGPSGGGQ